MPMNTVVAGGASGAVAICQGASLTVLTDCLIASASSSGSANVATGNNSNVVGQDGSVAAIGGGTTGGTTSQTFASFAISTTATGTTNFTFACVNSSSCTSPMATTLSVTVNASVAAPTGLASLTRCLSDVASVTAVCPTTGSTAIFSGAQSLTGGVQSLATSASGVFAYSVVCVNSTCSSTAVSFTLTVNPRPNNASLTAVNGMPMNTVVAGGASGAVAICQGASLTVNTDCFIASASSSGSANVATGANSGIAGVDGSTAAVGGGTTGGTTSTTFASFVISTTATGVTNFTFACVNSSGCASPQATTLSVTVNSSVAAPTGLASLTRCLSDVASVTAVCPTAGSTAIFSGAESLTGGIQSLVTSASGVFAYTVVCANSTCTSTPVPFTLTVQPRPADAALTVRTSPTTTLTTVAAAGIGSVSVCQNQSLTVVTNCLINTATGSGTANTATGVNSGSVNQDGSIVAIANGVSSGATSNTFAAFVISTSAIGTTTFTFQCQNSFSCTSPNSTTLALVVSGSVANATIAARSGSATTLTAGGVSSVCVGSTLSLTALACPTGTSAIVTGSNPSATVASGTSYVISTSAAGVQNFSVVCRTAAGCVSATPQQFSVLVNAIPNNAGIEVASSNGGSATVVGGTSGPITVCEGSVLTGLVTGCPTTSGAVPGSTASIAGSGQIFVGGSTPGSTTTSVNSFTIPGTLTAGTYNYTVVCTSVAGSATCTSQLATTLVVNVIGAPVSPTATVSAAAAPGTSAGPTTLSPVSPVGNYTVCQNSPISLTVNGCNAATPGSQPGAGGQVSGSAVLGGSQIVNGGANPSNFTILNTATGVYQYTVNCQSGVTGCKSLTSLILNVTVNPTPAAPVITGDVVAGSSVTLCQGKSAIGTVTCPVNSVPSQSNSTNSFLVNSNASSGATSNILNYTATASTSSTGIATFSVICVSTQGGCPSLPTAYTLVVNPVPADAGLTVSPARLGGVAGTSLVAAGGTGSLTICQGSPISVTVTGCDVTTIPGSTSGTGTSSQAGASFGGVQITAGSTVPNVFTVSTANTGVFAYTAVCTNAFGCTSPNVTTLNVTVTPTPESPTITAGVTTTAVTQVCQNILLVGRYTCPTGSGRAFVTSGAAGAAGIAASSATAFTVNTGTVGVTSFTLTCTATQGGCPSAPVRFTVNVNSLPNNASLTAVGATTPANVLVAGGGPAGALTICQGQSLSVVTNCLIGTNTTNTPGNSLTGINSGNTGASGVVDGSGSTTQIGVGGSVTGGSSTSVYAAYLLGTSVTGTTTYTFVCINAAGCSSPIPTTLAVTVNPTPAAPAVLAQTANTQPVTFPNIVLCQTAGGPSPISVTACPTGTTATIATNIGKVNAVAGSTAFEIVTTLTAAQITAGGVNGSFTVTCTNSSSCTSSQVANLTINAAPPTPSSVTISAGTPAFVSTSSITVCRGQMVELKVDGCPTGVTSTNFPITGGGTGFTFSGSLVFVPAGGSTAQSTSIATGSLPLGRYEFGVRCTNANGCQSIVPVNMTLVVTDLPSAVAVTGFAPTCVNARAIGTVGCTVGTPQIGIASGPATAGAPIIVGAGTNSLTYTVPTATGLYTLTAVCTTGGACAGTPVTITVNSGVRTPAPTSVQTVQNAICLGTSTTLTASCPTPGATVIWYEAGSTNVVSGTAIGLNALVVTPTTTGSKAYEAVCSSSLFACPSGRSTDIILNVLPGVGSQPTISARPNPSSPGQSVTLTAAGCMGTTVFYVQGTNTEVGRSSNMLAQVLVNPLVTTVYDAVCTNGQCTSPRTTGTPVLVTPCNFVANVTPSSSAICPGGTVVLTASGGASYAWANGGTTQSITATAPGIYNVIVTDALGCTSVGSATVTAGQAPTPTITGNVNIVQGQSTQLTAGGGAAYLWNGPGLANGTGSTQTVGQAGTYTVVVTSASGCTAAATVTVTVSMLPGAPTVTPAGAVGASAPLQACVGQTVQLNASCATGTPRFKMGGLTNDASSQNVSSATPGVVTYQVVCVVNGAEGPATTASVNFNAAPTVAILQTGQVCTSGAGSATLSATGTGITSYTWSTGATGSQLVANAAGMYSVNVSNAAGCVSTAAVMVQSVPCVGGPAPGVLQVTGATVDCRNGNVTITATGGNGNQIQYSIGNVQYSPSNPVALDPAVLNNASVTFINLYARQVNSTSTGFDTAGPFQYNLRAACPISTTPVAPTVVVPPSACGSPVATVGQPLVVTGVDQINCNTGSFRVLTTGGNGTAIDYSVIVGLSNADANNCIRRVDNNEQLIAINSASSTITPFRIDVKQNGVLTPAAFCFDFKAACAAGMTATMSSIGMCIEPNGPATPPVTPPVTPPAPPVTPPTTLNPAGCGSPANTVGQPLTISGVDQVNCQAGTFRILTTGGNGNTINYADIVGLSNNDPYNCTRVIDNAEQLRAINNPNSSIGPFSLRVRNIGGGTSNTFSFNMKQVCSGSPRVARTESTGTLDVTVLGNPTLGETVEVEVRGAEGQALQLRLVDGLGAAISEKSVEKAGAVERQTISLGRSAGMYFLQVTTPDKSKTVKVVRQ
ncbi:MAG: T9SS C-terminal target domain-containing protein [Cytophagales bacterium]|nr:MAG: T9SS C-terminal target domain-containing protein [Cytophagales bacterium]